MTFARAGHGLVHGSWRCGVRFRFIGGNFLRRSMSIFAVMMFVVAGCVASANADIDMDGASNCLEHVFRSLSRALWTNAFAGFGIDPSLFVFVPTEISSAVGIEGARMSARVPLYMRKLFMQAVRKHGVFPKGVFSRGT